MGNHVGYGIVIAFIVSIVYGHALYVFEDTDRDVSGLNFPCSKESGNELKLARLLITTPSICHFKRNSELINSLLGLPKNMNNVGK